MVGFPLDLFNIYLFQMTTVHKVNDFEVIKKQGGVYSFSNMPFFDEYLSNTTLKFNKNGDKIEVFETTEVARAL